MNLVKKSIVMLGLFSLISTSFLYADNISFSAGKTSVSLSGDNKSMELSENANIDTGDINIKSGKMLIKGDGFSQIECIDNVSIIDYKHNISIFSTSLSYDRDSEKIIIDGWVEMQDLNNKIAASAAWLDFDMQKGIIELQIRAKILKETTKGIMICRADTILFNRDANTLLLIGNAKIDWDKDNYSASTIQVDLSTESIKMIGKIKGTVNG